MQPFDTFSIKVSKRRLRSRDNIEVPDELCGQVNTPQCLQHMYNIPSAPATAKGNTIAVSSFGNENALSSDLQASRWHYRLPVQGIARLCSAQTFLSQVRPDIKNGSFTRQRVDNFTQPNKGTTEAVRNVAYVMVRRQALTVALSRASMCSTWLVSPRMSRRRSSQ